MGRKGFEKLIGVLIVVLFLAGCIGAQVPATKEGVTEKIEVEQDPYAGTWKISTPLYYGGVGKGYSYFLRGGGVGNTPRYFQIYFTTTLANWYFLESAIDIDQRPLPLRKITSNVNSSGGIVTVNEDVAVEITRDYLETHQEKSIQIRLYGKGGTIEVNIVPQIVNGFLEALDNHLATQ